MKRAERLRQVGIGVQLRKMRENSGMTTRSVATALGLSSSSVSRNELGQRVPTREEASALCALYGVTGEDKKALIERVGETAETAAWLEAGHISDDLASLMVLEREAVSIVSVEVALIPGLAQTADYSRLVLSTPASEADDLERRVATRLGRQAILSRPNAPQVSMLIEEGALHRTLGQPRVMREQLEHLLALQRRDNVSVRVIPFEAHSCPANGSFWVYELAQGNPYVLVEAEGLNVFASEPAETQPFVTLLRTLDTSTLDEQGSSALIRKITEGLDNE